MSEQENRRLVEGVYDSFKAGNTERLLGAFAEDVDWRMPDIEHVPFTGRRQGRDQVGEFFAHLAAEQEVVEFEPKEYIAQGDKVVVLGHYAWRVVSTGRKFEADWAHVFAVRGGQITRVQEYTDTAAAAAAYRKA